MSFGENVQLNKKMNASDELTSIEEASNIVNNFARELYAKRTKQADADAASRNPSQKLQIVEKFSLLHENTYELVGRIIAEDVVSHLQIPNFDNSGMDGYVCSKQCLVNHTLNTSSQRAHLDALDFQDNDNKGHITRYKPIAISGEICAGDSVVTLAENTCMRIFTGAAIPQGGDIVIPQEDCILNDTSVSGKDDTSVFDKAHTNRTSREEGAFSSISLRDSFNIAKTHIRSKGLNFEIGDIVCKKGRHCSPELLSVLVSAGIEAVWVYKKISVAICATGDELRPLGTDLQLGQIYDSNSVLLAALASRMSCKVELYRINDNFEDTQNTLIACTQHHDLIICSGGVSVGDKDYIKQLMLECGEIFIRKVAIKPGKPFTLATFRETAVVCLPGNPLSAYITYMYFVVPLLKIMQGNTNYVHQSRPVQSPLAFASYARTQFIFAYIDYAAIHKKSIPIYPLTEQSSSALVNLSQANGALIVPANTKIEKGDTVMCFPFPNMA